MFNAKDVTDLRERIGVGNTVAFDLLILSGGDVDMAEEMSLQSQGLDQCKSRIINERFLAIEEKLK